MIVSICSIFKRTFILPSLLKQCLPLCPISQNLYSHILWIGAGREINKEYILNHPGCFLCFGKIKFIVITYMLTSTHNKRVSKIRKKIQKWLEGSHLQSSDYHKQCINHILGSCKHPKLVFCFCYLSNGKYEQQDMCSRYALVISHGDSVTNRLLYITFHLFLNLIVLIKPKKSQVLKKKVYACTDMHFTEQFLLIISSLRYHIFSVAVAFKNRNENKPVSRVPSQPIG